MIEDLINQGASLKKAVDALKEEKLVVKSVFSIVSYEMKIAQTRFSEELFSISSLCSFSEIVSASKLSQEKMDDLKGWQKDPGSWK